MTSPTPMEKLREAWKALQESAPRAVDLVENETLNRNLADAIEDLLAASPPGEARPDGELPAEQLFTALRQHALRESDVSDALLENFGVDLKKVSEWPCEDIVFDDYDASFEFKGVRDDWIPSAEGIAKCWLLGFQRCWICYLDGTERYYDDRATSVGERVPGAAQRAARPSGREPDAPFDLAGVTLTDAAQAFWDAVQASRPTLGLTEHERQYIEELTSRQWNPSVPRTDDVGLLLGIIDRLISGDAAR